MASCVSGPVPSRRLGRSLGVDLMPFKTCTHNCIYGQPGGTTRRTQERRAWKPVANPLEEMRSRLSCNPDYQAMTGEERPG